MEQYSYKNLKFIFDVVKILSNLIIQVCLIWRKLDAVINYLSEL